MTQLDLHVAKSAVDDLLVFARNRLIKASQPDVVHRRNELEDDVLPAFTEQLARYFRAFAERALPVAKAVAFKWDPDDIDWTFEERELGDLFAVWYSRIGTETYAIVSEQIGAEVAWDLNARGVQSVLDSIGTRVKGINEASREVLRAVVGDALDGGYSIEQLVRGVPDDNFTGLRDLVSGWQTSRAKTIALTETGTAMNRASVSGYRDSGLVDKVRVLDGTNDDICVAANGSTWTLAQAEANPLGHPNCQRAFVPIAVGAS